MSEDTLFDDQIVRLNIGGKKFITSKTTLVSKGENFFSGLLGGVIRSTKIEGYYFIDRDGKYFKAILEFLRTGHLEIPDGISELALLREMQFYGIDLSHQTSFLSDTLLRDVQYCRIKEIMELKEIIFSDWMEAARNGLPLRSRIFCYDVDTTCKLLENEFEISNKNASDYVTRRNQFLQLLPEVKEGYRERIRLGEVICNTECVTFLNKDENRVILIEHFKLFHRGLSIQIVQQRAYRVTYKSYTNMDFNGWQFINVIK
eukprot:TRINITY_DN10373_c0_g1_i1.p1 TRINITY_DN10373_c0_g1~~TRINITY_DN10373_c0_g1_i1.p1  ORF type:complete len:278 (+),score=44.94 TRINITY_DN10373_c0_g1_i1:57-836(+)